jgi:hypothetical protein
MAGIAEKKRRREGRIVHQNLTACLLMTSPRVK